VEPLILDLNKTAINMDGLTELQGASLIQFISRHAKN
jgi:hypothetical protein